MVDATHVKPLNTEEGSDLGLRLKCIREHNGLSQRELAKKAGVPHSSISMIEQGINSPSINSLTKILSGIPMSLAQFFACDLEFFSQNIFRSSDLQSSEKTNSWGAVEQSIPFQHNKDATTFKRTVFPINCDTGNVPRMSTTYIGGYVSQGQLEISINSDVSLLVAGDAFTLAPNQPYRFRNLSAVDECIVILCEA